MDTNVVKDSLASGGHAHFEMPHSLSLRLSMRSHQATWLLLHQSLLVEDEVGNRVVFNLIVFNLIDMGAAMGTRSRRGKGSANDAKLPATLGCIGEGCLEYKPVFTSIILVTRSGLSRFRAFACTIPDIEKNRRT